MESTLPRRRLVTWEDPLIGAQAARNLSGLEYLLAMKNGTLPVPPVMKLIGLEGFEAMEGRVVFAFTPEESHYNPIGTVHGGVITTVLDSAMGCTVHSTLPAGVGYTTLELKVNFLRPLTTQTGLVRCAGRIIHSGSKSALVEAQLTDGPGKVYAHAVSTCLILR